MRSALLLPMQRHSAFTVDDVAGERAGYIQTVVHRRVGTEDANPARKAEGAGVLCLAKGTL